MKLSLNLLLSISLLFVLSIHMVEAFGPGMSELGDMLDNYCNHLETPCSTYNDCESITGESRCCYQGSCYRASSFTNRPWSAVCNIEDMDSNSFFPSSCYAWTTVNHRHRAHHSSPETSTDSTRLLEQPTMRPLVYVNDRATALAACGKFEEAIRAANVIRIATPSSGLGYLCQGRVYQLQGRYEACMDICDRGLTAAASSDPYYQQLVHMRSRAAEYNTLKIDFMKGLPLEIIEIIVNKLLAGVEVYPKQLCEYLSISRLWQQRILEYARDLHVVSSGYERFGEYVLKQSAPRIAALTLQYKAAPYQLFHRAQFSSLQSLTLYEVTPDHPNPTAVFDSLALVRPTLTHLEIHFPFEWEPYPIEDILDTFRLLVSLRCYRILNDPAEMATMTTHPHLKELKLLPVFGNNFESHQLDSLTRRLPALEILCVHRGVDSNALPMIQNNCPNLKSIMYNDFLDDEPHKFILYNDFLDDEPHKKRMRICSKGKEEQRGLRVLTINRGFEDDMLHVETVDVTASMTRNAHSLQSIYLRFECMRIPDLIDITFDHLTYFTHVIFCHDDLTLSMWVIRNAPNLQHVELVRKQYQYQDEDNTILDEPDDPEFDNLDQVFANLSGLPHLEVVIIEIEGSNAAAGIQQFLEYHTTTIESKLRHFEIPDDNPLSLDVLDMLTRLPRLEDLDIQPPIQGEDDAVYRFLEKLAKGCPRIHRLSLYGITGDHLPALQQFPNLEWLYVETTQITQDDLLILAEFPKLSVARVNTFWHLEKLDPEVRRLLNSCLDIFQIT
ncbi:predicted protein [Lichtheimia corymbifera JMRC:FSU:9682]|uniref:F-box domain-containing protein n=1 Tax=Lichtheimia corymbifera JMRC:FSU:9682 TaxID=1263082 RepID=A0A068RMR8_9FUNG|nr:predicted protein [Lichtheimia corymbifera JMRC:FSU:9682]